MQTGVRQTPLLALVDKYGNTYKKDDPDKRPRRQLNVRD